MNKFTYGNFNSSNTDIAFSATSGYVNPSTEVETRKQLSYPLKELKTFINNTVSVDSSDEAVQLVIDGRLKYRSEQGGFLSNVPGCVPTGGTQGQFIRKVSSTDADIEWVSLPTIYSGTTEPSADLGNDGDIYFLYEE